MSKESVSDVNPAQIQQDVRPRPPLLLRAGAAIQYMLRGINPDSWFGSGRPIDANIPEEARGRQTQYPIAYNLRITPKDEGVSFQNLRSFADMCTLVRGAIETRKDNLAKLKWGIRKTGSRRNGKPDETATKIQNFLQYPDREHDFSTWFRELIEDEAVIDQPTLYGRRTIGGDLFALELIDGATVKRIIGSDGRTPFPPDPAYKQVFYGQTIDYTMDELLVYPRNPRTNQIYGFSIVEQLLIYITTAIRRDIHKLEWYTKGSVPDMAVPIPEAWSPAQREEFMNFWVTTYQGNTEARRGMPLFVPETTGNGLKIMSEAVLTDPFDEWLARVVCWFFGLSYQALVGLVNRGTGQVAEQEAKVEGKEPQIKFWENFFTLAICRFWKVDGYEFAFMEDASGDELKKAQADDVKLKNGTANINEIREEQGKDPIEGGDVYTVTAGLVPVTDIGMPVESPAGGDAGQEEPPTGVPKKTSEQTEAPPADDEDKAIKKKVRLKPARNPQTERARGEIADLMRSFLTEAGQKVTTRITNTWRAKPSKHGDVQKADDDDMSDAELAGYMSVVEGIDYIVVIEGTRAALEASMRGQATVDLAQLKIDRSAIIGKVDARIVEYARKRSAEMVGRKFVDGKLVQNPRAQYRIDEVTRETIRDTIANSFEQGLSAGEVAQAIEDTGMFSSARAEMIADTELARANASADMTAWRESGVVTHKVWLLSNEHEPGDECTANAAEGEVPLDDEFQSGDMMPPQHPNCRCSWAPVTEAGEEAEVESDVE